MLAVDTLEVQTLKSRKQISFEPRGEMLQIKPLKKKQKQKDKEKENIKKKEKKEKQYFAHYLNPRGNIICTWRTEWESRV